MSRTEVHTPQGCSGVLDRTPAGFLFAPDPRAPAGAAVSLTMPVRLETYRSSDLHPVFQMNLPEGYLLERLRHRLAKSIGTDPLLLLAIVSGEHGVGRLRYAPSGEVHGSPSGIPTVQGSETLSGILAYRGAEGLFDSLVDRYLLRSGLSGMQPKVLVPERAPVLEEMTPATGKAVVTTSDLIVKSGQGEFPALAVNEFVCMTAVARAGIPVPEFFLSDDHRLFVMRRFDRTGDGRQIGFEDMAVLAGKSPGQKYEGSYSLVAKLVKLFCTPESTPPALQQLFDMVAISCLLENGDAHLKNFGLVYDEVDAGPVSMAPAFDIVNTTCYLPDDALALSLAGHRSLFASRETLLDFAAACNLTRPAAKKRIAELVEVADTTFRDLADLVAEVPHLGERVARQVRVFAQTFR